MTFLVIFRWLKMSSGHFLSSLEPHFSNLTVWCHACVLSLFSRVQLFAMPWTIIHQAPLSMGFSRQEDWSGLPFPPPGDLLDPGIKPKSFQLCLTLCDSMDCRPPGSSGHGTLQARILEWVAMLSSRGSSRPRDWTFGLFNNFYIFPNIFHLKKHCHCTFL